MALAQTQSTLDAARAFAAAGNYAAATALLDGMDGDDINARLLRAKIFAQQSRFKEALAEWQQVLAKEPQNGEAQEGIALAEKFGPGVSGIRLRARLYLGIVSLLVLFAVGFILFSSPNPTARPAPSSESVATVPTPAAREIQIPAEITARLQAAEDEIGRLRNQNNALAASVGAMTNLIRGNEERQAREWAQQIGDAKRELEQLKKETGNLQTSQRRDAEQLTSQSAQRSNELTERLQALSALTGTRHTNVNTGLGALLESLLAVNKEVFAIQLDALSARRDWLRAKERAYQTEMRRQSDAKRVQELRTQIVKTDEEIKALREKHQAIAAPAEEALEALHRVSVDSRKEP